MSAQKVSPKPTTSPFRGDILKDKVALVTGGGSGIGFEIARQLGLHGAKVVIMGRREAPLRASVEAFASQGIDAAGFTGDVRNEEDAVRVVAATVQRFGALHILVNNAAGNFLTPAEDLRPKGFKTVMDIDASGVFNMSTAAFPELKKQDSTLIINITATLHYGATWWQAHASAAKAAIDSLTRSLGLEWGEYGIRVAGIAPGPIAETAGLSKLGGAGGDADAMFGALVPVGRAGTTLDIAFMAVFLASPAAGYISGETIVVDGGQWLNRFRPLDRDAVRSFSRDIEKDSRQTGIAGKSKL